MSLSNPIEFSNRLTEVEKALSKGNVVTAKLKTVNRKGIKWAWIVFTRAFLSIFNPCTKQDPWKAYRINSLVKALDCFAASNTQHLGTNEKAHLNRILMLLGNKINKRTKQHEFCQKSISALSQKLALPEKQVKPTPYKDLDVSTPEPVVPYLKPETQATVRKAITNFANDLCTELSAKNNGASFSISPVSIVALLGMGLQLIHPDKKAEYLDKIGLKGIGESEAHEAIATTLKQMTISPNFKNGTIHIAQGIGHKKPLDPSFNDLTKAYNADLIHSNDLLTAVNDWVSAKTNKNIPSILSDNKADLILLNALYLALRWKDEFYKPAKGWSVVDFTLADGTKAPVSMMHQKEFFPLYQNETFALLEKPYLSPKGRQLSQLIFLPRNPQDLAALENTLTAENIAQFRKEAKTEKVDLKMPKTKAESEFSLLDILKRMGFPFDHLDPVFTRDDFISEIIHKTYISNDEKGTEAAAVTGLGYCTMSMPVEPKQFHITHSFAYMVMDGDAILFRGRVTDKTPLVVD